MKTKKTLVKKLRNNPWIVSTLVLGVLCLFLILQLQSSPKINLSEEIFNETEICQKISGTPSWTDDNGQLVMVGYKDFGENPGEIVNLVLIPRRIHFFYNTDCGWCKKQKEYFGDSWRDYLLSNLTHECGGIDES